MNESPFRSEAIDLVLKLHSVRTPIRAVALFLVIASLSLPLYAQQTTPTGNPATNNPGASPSPQTQQGGNQNQHWRYDNTEPPVDDKLPQASKEIGKRIKTILKEFSNRQDIGEKAGEIVEQQGKAGSYTVGDQTFSEAPKKSEIDEQGFESNWKNQEYVEHDSKEVIMHDDTFAGCFEERYVTDQQYVDACRNNCTLLPVFPYQGVGPGPQDRPEVPALSGSFPSSCIDCANFHPLVRALLNCKPNNFYVSESYFPVYQVAANKSGARSIDVKGFPGPDGKPEFSKDATKQRYYQASQETVSQILQDYGIDGEVEWPEWYKPSSDFIAQSNAIGLDSMLDDEVYHSVTYQTNVHRQATRNRPMGPAKYKGFDREPKCALSTLDDPMKNIISSASDGSIPYLLTSLESEYTKHVDYEAWQASVLQGSDTVETAGKLETLPQLTPPGQRAQEWNNPFGDLKALELKPADLKRDWIFEGHTMAPFSVSRYGVGTINPVHAGISLAVTHYFLSGLEGSPLNNKPLDRALKYSRFNARPSAPGYYNNPFTQAREDLQDQPIIWVDKIQLAYPPIEDKGQRKGTGCFRPENLGKFSPGSFGEEQKALTDSGHINIPQDLRARFPEMGMTAINQANEVRIVVWIKRINCHCSYCGNQSGCLNLHDGDEEEEGFLGKQGFTNPAWHPSQGHPS